jgi:hypothetical protein
MYEGYTLGLALMDYLPVIFSGIGLFFISRIIYQDSNSAGQTALLGALLVVGGGLCKASWKLFIATSGADYPLLNEMLWLLMGPGFTLIFAATLQWSLHASHKAPKVLPILMAVIVLAASLWMKDSNPESRASFFILLGATVVFSSSITIAFIGHGVKEKLYLAAALLGLNLCLNIVMQRLAQGFDPSATAQWIAQSVNAGSQLFFAIGIWLIYRYRLRSKT